MLKNFHVQCLCVETYMLKYFAKLTALLKYLDLLKNFVYEICFTMKKTKCGIIIFSFVGTVMVVK